MSAELCGILKLLHRRERSQAALARELNMSRAWAHKQVHALTDLGFISATGDTHDPSGPGRPGQELKISAGLPYVSALIIHTTWRFSLELYRYGSREPLIARELSSCDNVPEFVQEIAAGLSALEQECALKAQVLLLATQATLEQGADGIMYRNNHLKDECVPLARLLKEATSLPSYVYNYAIGPMLSLYHAPGVDIDSALVLMCGEGSVALGVFIDGRLITGQHDSFPECSHLPYPRGFEKCLGSFTAKSADALSFAIRALAPIFNLRRVIVAGSTFKEHLEALGSVMRSFRDDPNPLLRNLSIEYREKEMAGLMDEFINLSFDRLVEVLDPSPQKKSLPDFLAARENS
ncbi:MAG: ROK family transcriptional regulator [Succinivibrio sp.]|nr:ROK family transcriptional regulator [Succinivibrio sp.]